jgi:hypothetical protein
MADVLMLSAGGSGSMMRRPSAIALRRSPSDSIKIPPLDQVCLPHYDAWTVLKSWLWQDDGDETLLLSKAVGFQLGISLVSPRQLAMQGHPALISQGKSLDIGPRRINDGDTNDHFLIEGSKLGLAPDSALLRHHLPLFYDP